MSQRPRRSALLGEVSAYRVPRHPAPVDWKLDANEGAPPDPAMLAAGVAALTDQVWRRYPSQVPELERRLAARFNLDPAQVLATAGADDALDRIARATLDPSRALVLTTPTFEMIPRYARGAGATVREIPWSGGPYPLDAVRAAIDEAVGLIALVTPNNPDGAVIPASTLQKLSEAAPWAVVLVDHAYVEFAPEHDLTALALTLPNVILTRTFSKAWGLAGARVGYAMGPAELIGWLRACGNPYAVTGPSAVMALARLDADEAPIHQYIERVRAERPRIAEALRMLGAEPREGFANFVYAPVPDALWLRDVCAGAGVGVRAFPGGGPDGGDALRITCPGDPAGEARVLGALDAAQPQAVLLDMDGVLVDVSTSYRQAIIQTAARWGVTVTAEDIHALKAAGDANNDWIVTQRLLQARGVEASLQEVTEAFEAIYQGAGDAPGLKDTERLLVDRAFFEGLRARGLRIGVVTGRPRRDAAHLLERLGVADLIEAMCCMGEAAQPKPHAAPAQQVMRALGVTTAWLLGDTPDDVACAREATRADDPLTIIPLGTIAPGDDPQTARDLLLGCGAARVLDHASEVFDLLDMS